MREGAPVQDLERREPAAEKRPTRLQCCSKKRASQASWKPSDIDHSACDAGRAGLYPASVVEELPTELAARFLEPTTTSWRSRYRVTESLRQRVRFSIYDVTRPGLPPGEGCFDLIMCRNLLIYLQFATQERVLKHLRCALSDQGYLCLGEAEWPTVGVCATLAPLSHRTRIFRATDRVGCGPP